MGFGTSQSAGIAATGDTTAGRFRPGATLVAAGLAMALAGCGGGDGGEGSSIAGLRRFSDLGQEHVTGPVRYPEAPPVGGDHSATPQTCGAYAQPVPNEQAVHSMEHGAVWITHRPDLPAPQVASLRSRASRSHVLVSPYPGLPAPVVASAWGRQVQMDSADDPRLEQFVEAFRQGPQTPEPGAPCTGQGTPLAAGP